MDSLIQVFNEHLLCARRCTRFWATPVSKNLPTGHLYSGCRQTMMGPPRGAALKAGRNPPLAALTQLQEKAALKLPQLFHEV